MENRKRAGGDGSNISSSREQSKLNIKLGGGSMNEEQRDLHRNREICVEKDKNTWNLGPTLPEQVREINREQSGAQIS